MAASARKANISSIRSADEKELPPRKGSARRYEYERDPAEEEPEDEAAEEDPDEAEDEENLEEDWDACLILLTEEARPLALEEDACLPAEDKNPLALEVDASPLPLEEDASPLPLEEDANPEEACFLEPEDCAPRDEDDCPVALELTDDAPWLLNEPLEVFREEPAEPWLMTTEPVAS